MQRRPVVDAVVESTRDRQNVVKRGTFVAPGRDRCQLKYLSSDVGSETYMGGKELGKAKTFSVASFLGNAGLQFTIDVWFYHRERV